jgi:DNA-binding PucR family transcriptional regulator
LEDDKSDVTRETLRAYLAAGRSVTSAAAVLAVNRNTVSNRLRSAEKAIGRPLDAWAAELEAVLRLEEFISNDGDRAMQQVAEPRPFR